MSLKNLFCWPAIGRSGLGNSLIPWARCELFARDHGVQMLAPQWTHLKIGPILRRELDKRFYIGLFKSAGYVRGIRRRWLLWFARRVSEADAGPAAEAASSSQQKTVVSFAGMEGIFKPLIGHHAFIRSRLYQILSNRVKRELEADQDDRDCIAVHVRRGDVRTIDFGEAYDTNRHFGLPLQWYIEVIRQIRQRSGRDLPVRVFSDGRDNELAALLAVPGTQRARQSSSIVDILRLARSRMIVTGGGSTFSMWAVFLEQAPCVWYPALRELYGEVGGPLNFSTDLHGKLSDTDLDALVGGLR